MQVNQSIHRAALYSAACDGENRHEHYTDNKNEETEHKVCQLKYFDFALSIRIIRELMQQRRRWVRKRHLKMLRRAPQNLSWLFHLVQFVKGWQFLFPELNCKRRYQSSGKEKESRCLEFTSSITRGISRRCRAVTAKQCTKKRDARADLVFFWPI